MVSLSRRQVLISGALLPLVPTFVFAGNERLVLSGRITDAQGHAIAGLRFQETVTDVDGRFVLVTRGSYPGARRDADGTLRATVGLRV